MYLYNLGEIVGNLCRLISCQGRRTYEYFLSTLFPPTVSGLERKKSQPLTEYFKSLCTKYKRGGYVFHRLQALGPLRLDVSVLESSNGLVNIVPVGVGDADTHVAESDV
jgi:hypothetical protein